MASRHVDAILDSPESSHDMASPRLKHHCQVCGKPCPGFKRQYCSDACTKKEQARRKRSARNGSRLSTERLCVVCDLPINGPRRSKTCSIQCGEQHDRDARRIRNRIYHESVRKPGTDGVRQWQDWAAPRSQELREKAAKRRAQDPEHVRQINRASRARHAQRANERTRAWKAANPERVKEHRSRDYQKNKSRFRQNNLRRTLKKLAAGNDLRASDLYEILKNRGTKCAYCGQSMSGVRSRHLDHVIPLDLGGAHIIENIVVACAECNRSKWNRDPVEWLTYTGRSEMFARRFPREWRVLQTWREDSRNGVFPPRNHATIEEASRAFPYSMRTLRRRIKAGEVQVITRKTGRARIYFCLDYLERETGVRLVWNPGRRIYERPKDTP